MFHLSENGHIIDSALVLSQGLVIIVNKQHLVAQNLRMLTHMLFLSILLSRMVHLLCCVLIIMLPQITGAIFDMGYCYRVTWIPPNYFFG